MRDLDQRRVGGIDELAVGVALAEVADDAVVDDVEIPVGTEHQGHRAVDAAQRSVLGAEGLPAGGRLARDVPGHAHTGGRAVRVVHLVGGRAVVGEFLERDLERLTAADQGRAEVDELDVVTRLGFTVVGREAEVALTGHECRALFDDAGDEGVGREVRPHDRHISGLQRERRAGLLRRVGENVLDRDVAVRLQAGGLGGGVRSGGRAGVVGGTADRVEDGLRGVEETEPIRPAMVVGHQFAVAAHGLGDLEPVGRVVGRARPALVLTVLGDQEVSLEWVVLGREADAEGVPIAPRVGLDRTRFAVLEDLRPEDGAGARMHAAEGACERGHGGAGREGAVVAVAAGDVAITGVETGRAQDDVLAGDVVLVAARPVVVPGHTGVGGRALRPVEVAVLDDHLLGRMVAGGQPGDVGVERVAAEIDGDDAGGVVAGPRCPAGPLVGIGREQGAVEDVLEGEADGGPVALELVRGRVADRARRAVLDGVVRLADRAGHEVAVLVEDQDVGREGVGRARGRITGSLPVVAGARQSGAGLHHQNLEVPLAALEGDRGREVETLGEELDLVARRGDDVLAVARVVGRRLIGAVLVQRRAGGWRGRRPQHTRSQRARRRGAP
jgi:hypothetical protein